MKKTEGANRKSLAERIAMITAWTGIAYIAIELLDELATMT